MWDDDDLGEARGDFEAELLTQRAEVLRKSSADTPSGGQAATYAPLLDGKSRPVRWPARARQMKTPQESTEGGKLVTKADWEILLPARAQGQIEPTDRLRIGTVEYAVAGDDAGRTEQLCLVVAVKRLD